MHTEMAPTSSGAQGKGEPNVAASAAKCVIDTGHPAIYRRYRGIADMNGRVASANSVEFDPQRHLAVTHNAAPLVGFVRGMIWKRRVPPPQW
jgi:hypothetical protein